MFDYLIDTEAKYPNPPFLPDQPYPEFEGFITEIDPNNRVYRLMRNLFIKMGWDKANINKPSWNPFGQFVRNAHNIVIKPNLVLHRPKSLDGSIKGLVVHASVIRVIVDYLLLASRKFEQNVVINIADTPLQSADFERLCQENGLSDLMAYYNKLNLPVTLFDLRYEQAKINENFIILNRIPLHGDPQGTTIMDLDTLSAHYDPNDERHIRFGVQDYDEQTTNQSHYNDVHKYCFSNTVLDADLIINLCKMKTHTKAGVTLSLKNIIGANVFKAYLPHFRSGCPNRGGDEFPIESLYHRFVNGLRNKLNRLGDFRLNGLLTLIKRIGFIIDRYRGKKGSHISYGGAWYGNKTLYKTIVDVARCIVFGDRSGKIRDVAQRKMLCFADAIFGMEGDGPLKGSDKFVGLLAFGDDPVEFDATLCYFMGFDPLNVPHLRYWKDADHHLVGKYPFDIELKKSTYPNFKFLEPSGWKHRLIKTADQ